LLCIDFDSETRWRGSVSQARSCSCQFISLLNFKLNSNHPRRDHCEWGRCFRKPLKASRDRTDHTRVLLLYLGGPHTVQGFVCGPQYWVLSVGKLSVPKKSTWLAYIFSFYYYCPNIEMSIYCHRFLMSKAVRWWWSQSVYTF